MHGPKKNLAWMIGTISDSENNNPKPPETGAPPKTKDQKMKKSEILPFIRRNTRPEMARMEAYNAFCVAEPLIRLDWHGFKLAWPLVHPPKPKPKPKTAPTRETFQSCAKCYGVGNLWAFKHIRGGVCFDCNGRGKIKIYTKDEGSKNVK